VKQKDRHNKKTIFYAFTDLHVLYALSIIFVMKFFLSPIEWFERH